MNNNELNTQNAETGSARKKSSLSGPVKIILVIAALVIGGSAGIFIGNHIKAARLESEAKKVLAEAASTLGSDYLYELIYVNDDKTPELVVKNGAGGIYLFQAIGGEAVQVYDSQPYMVLEASLTYLPYKNALYEVNEMGASGQMAYFIHNLNEDGSTGPYVTPVYGSNESKGEYYVFNDKWEVTQVSKEEFEKATHASELVSADPQMDLEQLLAELK